ncbi:hypothetical protein CI109_102248 [Kwoniella shandongensis]|uniref:Uncharacterized protein n=1 Tax=Kwoniella shandongensis TaxID=1734106 RepID=A0A5M6BYP7_9TREE|nr:uncharacterized protein CI109_003598 [Kwoniella shandongensis]KAA5527944.1 hypothetical protein CI109_003598 [Kwoniella shandongensis]
MTTNTEPLPGTGFLSQKLFNLLTTPTPTVTSTLAASYPETSVKEVAEKLYGHHRDHGHHAHHLDHATGQESQAGAGSDGRPNVSKVEKLLEKVHLKGSEDEGVHNPAQEQWDAMYPLSQEHLEQVRRCGQWGEAQPSELFLNVWAKSLRPLETDPLKNLCSPPLIGATGVIPLSIISVIPDIIQHHADVIVRAEREIFLATNFWEASSAAQTIVDAFRELSRRVVERNGPRVVIKLMYDRGNPHQLIDPHQSVDRKTYTGDKVKLPPPEEIPGCLLEVQNYHEPPVGTFHAKYMVVDRRVALLGSNNIQDRVNVEMMSHIEGPIVQAFYDMALLSWSNAFHPPLPLLAHPPTYPPGGSKNYDFGTAHPVIGSKGDLDSAASRSREILAQHHAQEGGDDGGQSMQRKKEIWDGNNADEAERVDDQFTDEEAITKHLNTGSKIDITDKSPPPNAAAFKPLFLHTPHNPFPIALVNRPPRGQPGHGDVFVPQDQAWLAAMKFARKSVFIQTPTFNAVPIVEAALETVRRGVLVQIYADLGFNDEGELLPFQGGTNSAISTYMYSRLSESDKKNLEIYWYTGKDQRAPLNANKKSRNCHVKLMIVDSQIAIQGNGNQDTQSHFHSQEINILIDSPLIATQWRETIDSNQNTKYYGKVDPSDGIWRDPQGKELEGEKKQPKGIMKSFVGVKGAIQRVRGEGGF